MFLLNRYRNDGDPNLQLEIAKNIILAEYIGAIGMSILLHAYDRAAGRTNQRRRRINLTLIGAGAFGVDEIIVIDVLKEAIREYKQYDCDIIIHAYGEQTAKNIIVAFQ